MLKKLTLSILLAFAAVSAFSQKLADNLVLTLSNPDGIYAKGEKVMVFAELKGIPSGTFDLTTYVDGLEKSKSKVELKGGEGPVFSARYKKPTAVVLKFSRPDDPKDATSVGFVVNPEGFTPGFERPADFDEYWKGQIASLRALPQEVKLTEVPLKGADAAKYVCYDFELNCLGGKPVVGYLAYPKDASPKSLPIFMLLHAAGVSKPHAFASARGALGLAKSGDGAIGLDINAHGMPNGREQSYYDALEAGELKNYSSRIITDRESYYFLGMVLRELRALDYLCGMPQWDGKKVLLRGQSQGGFQACALAGLDPRVTAVTMIVPAGLDMGGYLKGRLSGWPKPFENQGQDPEAVRAVSPYFDCAQFLKGCKAEFHVELGLIDFTCPPAGCFAALNGVVGKKTILTDPYRPHGNVASPYMKEWQVAQNRDRDEWIREYLSSSIVHEGWTDFNKNGKKDVYEDPKKPVAERVEDLLSQMTLEEKTCQLVTLYGCNRVLTDPTPTEQWKERVWKDGLANIDEHLNGVRKAFDTHRQYIYPFSNHVAAIREVQKFFVEQTRLGIPVEFSNEGIHGLCHSLATPLPAPISMGSTWDRELVLEAGRIVGREASYLGYNSVYAPILDLARDQRWGRTLECYGEDPYLVAQLGTGMASGIQESGVGSGLKHFAAYSVPKGGRDGRARTDPHITPRELQEIFLYPFREVVGKTNPMVVMSSYNDWNGEPVTSSHYFLTDLLRKEFGFTGYVVSDSDAVEFVSDKHHVAVDYVDACRQVLEAGLNVRTNFTKPEYFVEAVRKALADGILSEETVNQRVREVLAVKFRMGLFDNPYQGNPEKADTEVGLQKNRDFALNTNLESFVLLKNDGILPLDRKAVKKVLVTGPIADEDNFMSSRYGPNGHPSTTILKGLQDYLAGSAEVVYEKGCEIVDKNWPESEIIPEPLTDKEIQMMEKACKAASDVDVIIAVMGEDDKRVGESRSRTSLDLPGRQRDLLMALWKTGKPVVLVLVNGQPLTVNWENKYLSAILETWFPNCLGGEAVAMTLFGDNNPSGKLTVTFPKSIGQIEYNFPYKKGSHGYQHKSGPNGSGHTRVQGPLYPFGYGLSYTTFGYSDLNVVLNQDGSVDVSASVTNTGSREGTEVVQLYVRDCVSSVVTYDSVLRGFERVSLKPGETKRVSFKMAPDAMKILDKNMNWTVEPGDFEVLVGSSSEDIRLKGGYTVK